MWQPVSEKETQNWKPDLERDGLHQAIPAQDIPYDKCPHNTTR